MNPFNRSRMNVTQTDVDNVNEARQLSRAGIEINLFTVFDKLAQSYAPPFTAPNDAVASRMLLASAQNADSMLSQSPSDFDLYHVGTLNTSTGVVLQEEVRWVANFGGILQAAMSSGAVKP